VTCDANSALVLRRLCHKTSDLQPAFTAGGRLQDWPVLFIIVRTPRLTALSSASLKDDVRGPCHPSSRWTFFQRIRAAAFEISVAARVDPVKLDHVDIFMRTTIWLANAERPSPLSPRLKTTPLGKACLGSYQFGKNHRVQAGFFLGGFSTIVQPGYEPAAPT